MSTVAHWLKALDLGQYADLFDEHAIDEEVLPELNEADLEKLGVKLGHRKKLLKAIAALGVQPDATIGSSVPQRAESQAPEREAEHRQLTVMFCDLVGSTALARRLEQESLHALIAVFQAECAGCIGRYGGFVARYMGDGLLAYFGYPQAHEDDAERGVRAGLELCEAVPSIDVRRIDENAPELSVRVGLATGAVVIGDLIGDGASSESPVLGEVPNLAARLQGAAMPGTVLISDATHRLTGNLFAYSAPSQLELKGYEDRVRAWSVRGDRAMAGRFQATRGAAALTPLVGRDEEIATLSRRWVRAQHGEGQVAVIVGEPGIGKSRLAHELRLRLAPEPDAVVRYQASPYHGNSALFPAIDELKRAARLRREDSPGVKLDKLEALLTREFGGASAVLTPLAELLSLQVRGHATRPALSPQRRRELILAALEERLTAMCRQRSVLVIFEDLHWADPTSLELLERIVDCAQRLAVLIVVTTRDEFQIPWRSAAHVTTLVLSRLTRAMCEEVIRRMTPDKAWRPETLEHVIAKTDGVPLFIEEVARMVLDAGALDEHDASALPDSPHAPLAVPDTLRDLLTARLDQQGEAKETAQLAAVIGRYFSFELLAATSPLGTAELEAALDKLSEARIFNTRGKPPDSRYGFTHALVQDAAYQSLLKARRQEIHAQVARALETSFPELAHAAPERLAQHYAAAGLGAQAIDYWRIAGERALEHSATAEAIGHLETGVAALEQLPEGEDRVRRELALRTVLGPALAAVKGFASAEVETCYRRARGLCQRVEDQGALFRILRGTWNYHHMRGELADAVAMGMQLLEIADRAGERAWRLEAHRALCATGYFRGEFTVALDHAQQGYALYDPDRDHAHAVFYGDDPGVVCLAFRGFAEWFTGAVHESFVTLERALALARGSGHAYSIARVMLHQACVNVYSRYARRALEQADAVIAYSDEQQFVHWSAMGLITRGAALVELGACEDGLDALQRGMEAERGIRAMVGDGMHLTMLGVALGRLGRHEEGLTAIADALAFARTSGAAVFAAEAHRARGELLLTRGGNGSNDEAEQAFRQALATARSQHSKSLELRAATSFAGLLRDTARGAEASALLEAACAFFPKDLKTPDLVAARNLVAAST